MFLEQRRRWAEGAQKFVQREETSDMEMNRVTPRAKKILGKSVDAFLDAEITAEQ